MGNKKLRTFLVYGVLLAVLFVMITSLYGRTTTNSIKYSQIVSYFNDGKVQDFELDFNSGELTLKLENEANAIQYKVPDVNLFLNDINDYIVQHNRENPDDQITYNYLPVQELPWWVSMLPTLLLIVGLLVVWYMMMNKAGGGSQAMTFGKAKIKPADVKGKVTFQDVAGVDEEKEERQEVVEFLKNPKKCSTLGARIPKGVLLMGPPGTGKTLLARAVAGEAGVPFYSISGSSFVEMFVGVGASRVRDLFEQAKKDAPSIVFIDEIDAVGRQRGAGLGGGHDEREQTLNQLLVEMDGFDNNIGVIVMAATNRRDVLDPALLRPGRFDRQVTVNYPDIRGREEILKVHSRKKPLAPDVDLSVIARSTPGFTGADLENLLNEAALLAARKNLQAITMKEIEEATIKVIVGPEKTSKVIKPEERKLTAFHEAGHAVVTYFCETQSDVHEISIIPRGMAGGYTLSLPETDRSYKRKKEMFEDVVVLLGGRVAESLMLDDISTGASNDLERATATAKSMVTRYGFSEKLGPVVYGGDHEVFLGRDFTQSRDYSEAVASEIDEEVRGIVDRAYERAMEILTAHKQKLITVAEALLEFEKIGEEQFKKLMEYDGALPTPPSPEAAQAQKRRPAPTKIRTRNRVFRLAKRGSPAAFGPWGSPSLSFVKRR